MRRRRFRREDVRRVVVVVPSTFTLGNLFFGMWAVVAAYNGNFRWAAWFIVFAAILDTLDGRLARRTNTTSRFGEELDSLVDVVSFGVAPALILYFLEFATAGRFGWVIAYFYVVAAAVRLARYNVVSAGKPSAWFTGMPSPAAGMTLATFYPFSQTPWYRASLQVLDLQEQGLAFLALLLALLMVSRVQYPKLPAFGFRTWRQGLTTALVLGLMLSALVRPDVMLFPIGIAYLVFGLLRSAFLALADRGEGPHDEVEPAEVAAGAPVDAAPLAP
ncbi:MAG TPA: CDP-diacylglycerol--serine O-phosphatidyltransferase, partial [Gemmatimonadales bacterium]|nr:CDP-diacylglycerol--serine O-phosphatidyltransferase [Gemmatimonadales bacterium]